MLVAKNHGFDRFGTRFMVANAVEKFGSELVKVGANLFHTRGQTRKGGRSKLAVR